VYLGNFSSGGEKKGSEHNCNAICNKKNVKIYGSQCAVLISRRRHSKQTVGKSALGTNGFFEDCESTRDACRAAFLELFVAKYTI
jgi:hypothetical protein